jgi:capsule polysaccharide export protein KpsE/RkpR
MREMAHLDALREQSYLERVVDPRAADKSCYPRRGLWIGCVLLVGLAIFWMFRPTGPATPPEYDWA